MRNLLIRALQATLALIGLVTMVILTASALTAPTVFTLDQAHAVLWLACGCLLVGLGGVTLPRERPTRFVWIMVALTLGAFLVRVLRIGDVPYWLTDEGIFMTAVVKTYEPSAFLNPVSGYASGTYMYPYWQRLATDLFGRSLFALRFPSAVMGALTVMALGFWVYEATRLHQPSERAQRLALMSSALLMTFPPHLHFSRLGLYNIVDPFFALLGFASVLRAVRLRHPFFATLAGLCFGLCQYNYEAGRLLVVPLLVVWLTVGGLLSKSHRLTAGNLIRMLVILLAVGVPVWLTTYHAQTTLTPRLRDLAIPEYTLTAIAQRAISAVRLLIDQADYVLWLYYGGKWGLVPLYLLPFFLIGLGLTLRHPRRLPSLLVVGWLVGTLTALAVLNALTTARYVTLLPLLVYLIALGLERVLPGRALIVGVSVLCLVQGIHYYAFHLPTLYGQHAEQIKYLGRYDVGWVMNQIATLPPQTEVHVIVDADQYDHSEDSVLKTTPYLNPSVNVYQIRKDEELDGILQRLLPNEERVFFITAPHQLNHILPILEARYQLSIADVDSITFPSVYRWDVLAESP